MERKSSWFSWIFCTIIMADGAVDAMTHVFPSQTYTSFSLRTAFPRRDLEDKAVIDPAEVDEALWTPSCP